MRCNIIEANEMERTRRIDVNIVWCIRDMMSNVRTVCMLYIVYAITYVQPRVVNTAARIRTVDLTNRVWRNSFVIVVNLVVASSFSLATVH